MQVLDHGYQTTSSEHIDCSSFAIRRIKGLLWILAVIMIVKSNVVTPLFFSTVENNQVVHVPDVIHDELTCNIDISAVIHVGIRIFWLVVLFGSCSYSLLSLTVCQSCVFILP